eukprot:TRINITY_DN204_c0_g1_i1.p1 TRINITY_DN204_c0_g1~~TRINITY_DN204_c0_g1_i1.p1  ORF type:complete len:326 (+),score=153.09 TRINITY_DN204_c0_g1_i1:98-1075(+)
MKQATLLRVLILSIFTLFLIQFIKSETHHLAAILNGAQEVPAANTTAFGNSVLFYSTKTKVLNFTINHNVIEPTAAHIHGPALRNKTAPPIITLNLTIDSTIIIGNATLTDEQINWLLNGSLYLNIHSQLFPDGEIRGQIEEGPSEYEAILNGHSMKPEKIETNSTGLAVLIYESSIRRLSYVITHNVSNPIVSGSGIFGPAEEDEVASSFHNFETIETPIEGEIILTSEQEQALKDDELYIVVASQTHSAGEIRGQIFSTGISDDDDDDDGLSIGAIIAIVAFSLILVVIIVGGIIFYINKKRKKKFELIDSGSTGDYQPPNNF